MVSVRRRLEILEAEKDTSDSRREVPVEVGVLLKAVERHRACADGEHPPPYSADELRRLHEYDQQSAAGHADLRDGLGWQSDEARAIMDFWQADALERLGRIESGESLADVYNDHTH